jgi:hypothetical protein
LRLWSLAPKYLDWKGLNALWREGLLAQAVLLGKTKGWIKHPQLTRFKNHNKPVHALGFYLLKIYEESCRRGYKYSQFKITQPENEVDPIEISSGQLIYESHILVERLKKRSPKKYKEIIQLVKTNHLDPHPMFVVVEGEVEFWEKSYWNRNTI